MRGEVEFGVITQSAMAFTTLVAAFSLIVTQFQSLSTLQKFSSIHAQVHNHFNLERHLVTREIYKQRRSAALAEWRTVMA